MTRLHSPAWTLLIATLLAACGSDSTGARSDLSGSANDPEGDGTLGDLVAASVTGTDDSLVFEARFAPGLLGNDALSALYVLDVDDNSASGDTSQDPPGSEYWVIVRENLGSPIVYTYQAGNWSGLGASGTNFISGDKLIARVPRSILGASAGPLRFKVQGASYDGTCPCYVQRDLLPDAGTASVKVK